MHMQTHYIHMHQSIPHLQDLCELKNVLCVDDELVVQNNEMTPEMWQLARHACVHTHADAHPHPQTHNTCGSCSLIHTGAGVCCTTVQRHDRRWPWVDQPSHECLPCFLECIQSLAHLNTIHAWQHSTNIADCYCHGRKSWSTTAEGSRKAICTHALLGHAWILEVTQANRLG